MTASDMPQQQEDSKREPPPRVGTTKPRPTHYNDDNPHDLLDPQGLDSYVRKYWWRPTPGDLGIPTDPASCQARVDRLFAAMTDFSDVYDSDNIFTDGRVINNNDIEYACLRIASAIDILHTTGLSVHFIADPTLTQTSVHRQKVWKIDDEQRNLTAAQREAAIIDHLRHYKKACLDAIQHDKDLALLFVAAPYSAGRKRDANAKSNNQRKRRRQDNAGEAARPTKRKNTKADSSVHVGAALVSNDFDDVKIKIEPGVVQDAAESMTTTTTFNRIPQDAIDPALDHYHIPNFSIDNGDMDFIPDENYWPPTRDYDWIVDDRGMLEQVFHDAEGNSRASARMC